LLETYYQPFLAPRLNAIASDVGFGEQFAATKNAVERMLTEVGLKRAAADAKARGDFFDGKQH
jgi:hypothetical protein